MPSPAYDPALLDGLKLQRPEDFTTVEKIRTIANQLGTEGTLKKYPEWDHTEYTIEPKDPAGEAVILSVFRLKGSSSTRNLPACYHVHVGGQIAGNRFQTVMMFSSWFKGIDMVHISVEYRQAPEHRAPAALDDCYRGLVWSADHAKELGIDLSKLMIEGTS